MKITKSEYVNFTELDNGDLKLELTAEGIDLLEETQSNGYKDIWWELLEQTSINGSYHPTNSDEIGGLTTAPMIVSEKIIDGEDGGLLVYDDTKVWYYEPYMIKDEFQELLTNNEITLTLVR